MKTKLFLLMPLLAGVFYMSGCQKDGCTDSAATNFDADATEDDGTCAYDTTSAVMLHFHPMMGTSEFAYNTEVTNWEGRKMTFTTAQVYLSGFYFKDGQETVEVEDSYVLAKAGTMMYQLGEVSKGDFDAFGFSVGVDSVANHADPAGWPSEHALSSNNPDHAFWSWNSGYIFIKVEGQVDTTANMTGTPNAPFVYHIGMDMLRNDLEFQTATSTDGDVTMMVMFDFLELFDGIDLRTDPDSHTMNNMPAAMALSNNVPNAVMLQ